MGSAHTNVKEGQKKEKTSDKSEENNRVQGTLGVKPPTISRAVDVFIGDEEQNGKQKKETSTSNK